MNAGNEIPWRNRAHQGKVEWGRLARREPVMSAYLGRGLAALVLLGGVNLVRADDLDDIRKRDEVARQKLIADTNTALAQSRTLEKSDPAKAVGLLKQVKSRLLDDTLLSDRQRASLLAQVNQRIQIVSELARAAKVENAIAAQKAADKVAVPKKKYEFEAKAESKGPASVAGKYIDTAKSQLDAAQRLKFLKENGFSGTLRETDLSAAQMQELRITERFLILSAQRKPKLDPKEARVLKALDSVMTVDFNAARFSEVMDELMRRTDVAIIVDEASR